MKAVTSMDYALHVRQPDASEREMPLSQVRSEDVLAAAPWRTFRSHRRQPHYSGLYWAATTDTHVPYESRHELARLILADFDPAVVGIAAQPFLLTGPGHPGRPRRHVPDFFFALADGTAQVVNVKPPDKVADPNVAGTLAWANDAFAVKGWRTEVWTGEDPVVLTNVRLLAAYRRPWLFNAHELAVTAREVRDGDTIREAEARLRSGGITNPRPLLLRLVWTGALQADLTRALDIDTRLERGS